MDNMHKTGRNLPLVAMVMVFLAALTGNALAQEGPTPFDTANLFGTEFGDGYTSIFLNQIFGPLFPAVDGSETETVFSRIIGYFNVIILVIGGLMFFWNVTVGLLQTAHEGQVLGQRWSSLWAPLRVLFAIGLLVPVPNLGGYNLAQAGIAYIVKGSTNIASAIWETSAEMIITGQTPITVAPARIDAENVKRVYMNAACAAVVNHQMQLAAGDGDANEVRFDLRTFETIDMNAYQDFTFFERIRQGPPQQEKTAIISYLDVNGREEMPNICGTINFPENPQYITSLASEIEGVPSDQYAAITSRFEQAHNEAMQSLLADMRSIVNGMGGQITDVSRDLPDITTAIRAAKNSAETTLQNGLSGVIDLATGGADRTAQGARDRLLARITGGNCRNNPQADGSAMRCYGEGWIGAGSLYIMMARLNSEIASLTTAKSSVKNGSYIDNIRDDTRRLAIAYGGFGFLDRSNRAMMSHEEAQLLLARYRQAFENSTAELAALGFNMSMDDLRTVSAENPDFEDTMEGSGRLQEATMDLSVSLINYMSPDNWGADPMTGIMNIGSSLTVMGLSIIGATAFFSAIPFFGGAGEAMATFLAPLVTVFLTAGGTLVFVLPLLPFIFWVLAVTGYFLLVIEAIVAVNLWALAHLRMDGEGLSGEAGRRGWLMMLALLMTPVLMIFGFLIGITIFRVSANLINIGFYQAAVGIYDAGIMTKMLAFFVYGIMIVVFYIVLLERSFSLISEFPNRVLRWMDAQADLDRGESERARAIALSGAAGSYQAAGGLSTIAGRSGSAVRGKLESRLGDASVKPGGPPTQSG